MRSPTVFRPTKRYAMRSPGRPYLTAVATALAIVAALVQYAVPGAVPALERDPVALAHGQWWRTVSPLFVQTLGWYQVLTNLVTLPLVGAVAELVLGRARWLLLFAVGTAAGEIAAYAWHEPGGGDSIAICGLAGGAVVAMLATRTPPLRPAAHVVIYYIAALTGWGLFGILGAGAAVAVTAVALAVRVPPRLGLAATIPAALVLAVVRDLHGVSLTAAMAVTAALVLTRRT
jgi:Rhomboid family